MWPTSYYPVSYFVGSYWPPGLAVVTKVGPILVVLQANRLGVALEQTVGVYQQPPSLIQVSGLGYSQILFP